MNRRLSRAVVAALFTLVLSLSTPSAYAMPGDGGWNAPDFGSRIARIVKKVMRHFGIVSQDDVSWPTWPRP